MCKLTMRTVTTITMEKKRHNGLNSELNQCSPRQSFEKNQQRYTADLFKIDEVVQKHSKSCSLRLTIQLYFVTSVIDVRKQYQTKTK